MTARPLILALGKFDSLHRGHRALLERAADCGRPAIVRFRGMAEVLGWQRRLPLLNDRQFFAVLGRWSAEMRSVIGVVTMDFERIRQLEPEAFMHVLRDEYRVGGVVVGEDFRFGRDRSGDVDFLRDRGPALGLQVAVEAAVMQGGRVLSTTDIRHAVSDGRIEQATAMLGRPYRLSGQVVAGAGRGRGLGFPTANCGHINNLLPATGVYAAWARLDGQGPWIAAALNIGQLPTFGGGQEISVEAHLIDWQGDCYGSRIDIDLVERLRAEERFAGRKALKAQISADVASIRAILGKGAAPVETNRYSRRITA